jgi:hypothetical protein
MTKMHADERDIPVAMVRSLIDTQFPQWRELALLFAFQPYDGGGCKRYDRPRVGVIVRPTIHKSHARFADHDCAVA